MGWWGSGRRSCSTPGGGSRRGGREGKGEERLRVPVGGFPRVRAANGTVGRRREGGRGAVPRPVRASGAGVRADLLVVPRLHPRGVGGRGAPGGGVRLHLVEAQGAPLAGRPGPGGGRGGGRPA